MSGQDVDLVREEDAGDSAAGAAMFTRAEILIENLIDRRLLLLLKYILLFETS